MPSSGKSKAIDLLYWLFHSKGLAGSQDKGEHLSPRSLTSFLIPGLFLLLSFSSDLHRSMALSKPSTGKLLWSHSLFFPWSSLRSSPSKLSLPGVNACTIAESEVLALCDASLSLLKVMSESQCLHSNGSISFWRWSALGHVQHKWHYWWLPWGNETGEGIQQWDVERTPWKCSNSCITKSCVTMPVSELLVPTRRRGNSEGMNQWGRTLTWCLILLQVDGGSYHLIIGVESLVFRIIRTQLKYIQSIVCTSGWNYQ